VVQRRKRQHTAARHGRRRRVHHPHRPITKLAPQIRSSFLGDESRCGDRRIGQHACACVQPAWGCETASFSPECGILPMSSLQLFIPVAERKGDGVGEPETN
jgi:hypothetical protein